MGKKYLSKSSIINKNKSTKYYSSFYDISLTIKEKRISTHSLYNNKFYMIRKNLSEYFTLGKWLWAIRDCRVNSIFTKKYFIGGINIVYDYCDKAWFQVSKWMLEKSFNPIIESINDMDDSFQLNENILNSIREEMKKCDEILDIESNSKIVYELYSPTENVNNLIDEPEKIIDWYSKFNDIERLSRSEWCKSLIYLLPTATVFYLMRVIESLTYRYCALFWVKQIIHPDDKPSYVEWMWDILQRLITEYKNNTLKRKTKSLYKQERVEELISIKKLYRNPTNHPNKIYTQEEANDLFSRSKSIINWLLEVL